MLLDWGRAKVYRFQPFTIILTERESGVTQRIEQKLVAEGNNLDPESKTTGMALIATFKKRGRTTFSLNPAQIQVVFAAHLEHRGQQIKAALDKKS